MVYHLGVCFFSRNTHRCLFADIACRSQSDREQPSMVDAVVTGWEDRELSTNVPIAPDCVKVLLFPDGLEEHHPVDSEFTPRLDPNSVSPGAAREFNRIFCSVAPQHRSRSGTVGGRCHDRITLYPNGTRTLADVGDNVAYNTLE